MKSMTGYGQAPIKMSGFSGTIEISSINKRGFELVFNLPREWQVLERKISELARVKLNRGRIRISANLNHFTGSPSDSWPNESLITQELENLKNYCSSQNIPFSVTPEIVYKIALAVNKESFIPPPESIEESLLHATNLALDEMLEMRTSEGNSLKSDLLSKINQLNDFIKQLEVTTPGMSLEWKNKLLNRLWEWGLEFSDNDERIAREVAIFADKSDISEELTRINSHVVQFLDCLNASSPIGRKLEFITQELLREFNTLASKSARAESSQLAINAKVELEKIREQISNIE